MKVFVIVPAGGSGKRCGGDIPKQYVKIWGKEVIAYTLEIFQNNPAVNEIIIAAQPEYFALLNGITERYNLTKIKSVVEGGIERQDSVANALFSLTAQPDDLIAVHDAARPLLSQEILTGAIHTAAEYGSTLVALSGRDTLLKGKDFIGSYIDRKDVHYAQTPQIFRYDILKKAITAARDAGFVGTDESMLVTRTGEKVKLTEGSVLNFKITTQSDLKIFENLTRQL